MNIEDLYLNECFLDELLRISNKNYLPFDDFRQNCFLEIIDSSCITKNDINRAVWRTAKRMKTADIKNEYTEIDSDYFLIDGAIRIA